MITMHARPRQTDEHHGNSAPIRSNECIARWKGEGKGRLSCRRVDKRRRNVPKVEILPDIVGLLRARR